MYATNILQNDWRIVESKSTESQYLSKMVSSNLIFLGWIQNISKIWFTFRKKVGLFDVSNLKIDITFFILGNPWRKVPVWHLIFQKQSNFVEKNKNYFA